MMNTAYGSIEDILRDVAESIRPPERLTVPQAAEKYRYINNPGSYVGPWDNGVTPYLIQPQEVLTSHEFTGMIFVGPAQCGKALALDTPIPTPQGWSTMGDLRVSDTIYGRDGKPCKVIFVTDVMHQHDCYRVTFDDGESIIADAEHKWFVNDIYAASKVLTTVQIKQFYRIEKPVGNARYRYAIPVSKPLIIEEQILPIDPYLLGIWLGNGGRRYGYLTLFIDDTEQIADEVVRRGGRLIEIKDVQENTRTFAIEERGVRIIKTLEELGLVGKKTIKTIPQQYLRASVGQRMALLRGLMDTDGCISTKGRCAFSTSDSELNDTFRELVSSLGIKFMSDQKQPVYSYRGEKRVGKTSYRTSFTVYQGFECFTLQRKLHRLRCATGITRPTHAQRRWIRNVVNVDSVPVRCIQVDSGDSLFLAGRGMIPTHNTDMLMNWLTHSVVCDPVDMMVVQTAMNTARDFSRRRIDRWMRHSKEIKSRMLEGSHGDNVMDKTFKNGMYLTLSWPSINELSGKPIPHLWLTDYDRMPMDLDGEGAPYDLAKKRTTTFRRFGMTVAESSPGFQVTNSKWMPKSRHEAPPTEGILALYNRGDRRRYYWQCPACRSRFEPEFDMLVYPQSVDILESAEQAVMECPRCAHKLAHDAGPGQPGKEEMNRGARWLRDGEFWLPDDSIGGKAMRSDIASFWLKGVCATFSDWRTLVFNYLKAEEEFEHTGSQEALKTTVNTDQGVPFNPRTSDEGVLPEELKSRAEDLGDRVVPEGVRFMVATIDIQKSRFAVQVVGFGEGKDVWIIDRFDIRKSKRLDPDGHPWPVSPGAYPEDWKILIKEVLLKTYPLCDDPTRHMQIKMVGSDSGGKEGVTTNAYAFYRYLKGALHRVQEGDPEDDEEVIDPNLFRRFQLLKGADRKGVPRVQISYPDSERKDRHAGARGEIPVLLINSDQIKDHASKMLQRRDDKGGRFHFPEWLSDDFYVEMTVEIKTEKGWQNPRNARNESWDLSCYAIALSISTHIGIEHIDWNNPPLWAAPWDENILVSKVAEEPSRFKAKPKLSISDLGEALS